MNRPTSGFETQVDGTAAAGPVTIVANPIAGGFRPDKLDRLAARLREAGRAVDIQLTTHAGHLIDIATHLGPDVPALVVGGGDGSLNEAVTGLRRRTLPAPPFGVLPFGTANVLAHELSLPFAPERIADAVLAGKTRPLHLGRIGERPFLLMVSAGFDADVVHAVDAPMKRRWGKLAYAAMAVRLALARQGRDVVVTADGDTFRCRIAVVTTARFYGGPLAITRNTHASRPGIRLVALDDDRPATLARAAVALVLGRLDRMAGVIDRDVAEVRLSGDGMRMQIDGDRMETVDAPIRADGGILQVITGR